MDLRLANEQDLNASESTTEQNEQQQESAVVESNTTETVEKAETVEAKTSETESSESNTVKPLTKESSFDINATVKEKSGYNSLDDLLGELGKLREAATQTKGDFRDDFIKKAVDFYNQTGDLTPYLEAKLVDYNKLGDEEILKRGLRDQYPTISDKALTLLYQEQVIERFKLDPDRFDELQVEVGKELLAAEASRLRSQYIEKQNQFKAPEPTVTANQTQQSQADLEQWLNTVKADTATNKLLMDKSIGISYNSEQFSYEVENPQALVDMTVDNTKFFGAFLREDGSVDLQKWYRVLNYAQDPETFERSLIAHGKTLGEEDVVTRRKNPSAPDKEGTRGVAGGAENFEMGLLKAFAEQGRHIN
jgi:hypothetical protein